ncbi:acetoacetate--CoA ligase [Methylocystis sp. IM3]|uniref:acetoacetate--CoA ligase n=1 Tax=unclassified Methylocystis TaxID=2625913 RepID=UPI0031199BB6
MRIWQPDLERQQASNLSKFSLQRADTTPFAATFDYGGFHRWSVDHKEEFWSNVWDFCKVIGEKGARILVDGDKMSGAQWFLDARLNFAENLLRSRPDDEISIVFSGEGQVQTSLSFGQLKQSVAALAVYFRAQGVAKGDRIAAYIHNGPEAIIGMLAASSIGAIWSSCAPEFGVQSVVDRFGQIDPSLLIASDGYLYKGKKLDRIASIREVQARLPRVKRTLIVPYIHEDPPLDDLTSAQLWPSALKEHNDAVLSFERLPFNHPLYIMFSSGTTGAPKCIVHGAGGTLLQHLKEHQLQCDIKPGDRVFYATSTGWMMWNWLASALTSHATILLYDGFFTAGVSGAILLDFAQEQCATLFGTSAGYLKAIEKAGLKPRESHDLSAVRLIASTGSPLLPDSFDYVYRDFKPDVQLASVSGGTDIISCFVGGNPWSPVYRGEIQCAGLGMAVEIWNDNGQRVIGEGGELVCTKSFPSMPICFWNDPDGSKYFNAYFARYPNVWLHGDFATETEHGGFLIHGRSDATLNPQGVRIGTADIYNVVESLPSIQEALAIDQEWDGGTRIVLFVKTHPDYPLDDVLVAQIKRALFEKASPRHVPAVILEAPDLPRTRSGKLVELAVREVVHGRPVKNRGALANPESLDFFRNLPELTIPRG